MFGELTGDASWALLAAMEQSYAEAQRHTFDAAAAVLRSCHQTTLADELGRLLPPREPYTPPDVMHADVKRRVLNAASLALHLCCRSELVSELAELRARGAALARVRRLCVEETSRGTLLSAACTAAARHYDQVVSPLPLPPRTDIQPLDSFLEERNGRSGESASAAEAVEFLEMLCGSAKIRKTRS